MKSNIDRADRILEATEFPEVILIDNCNACNLQCSMCDHKNIKKYRKIQLMDRDLYEKLIDEIAIEKPGARVWQIFFGEPFLCRDMPKRIRYAKEKGLKDVVLNSNAVMMNRDRSRAIIEAGLDAMYVGIDAATKQTYDKIRVGGDLEKAIKNVLGYKDLLDEIGTRDQKLFVQFVQSDINESEIDEFKSFWNKNGVNIKIRPKVSWAGLVDATNLQNNAKIGRKPCYWIMQTINICADGEVALCSVDVHCRVKCGNAREHSIKELWRGRLGEYRAMHREGRFSELPEMCRKCSDWQSAYADYVLSHNAKTGCTKK